MIAIETNILVHAHRPEMPAHAKAKAAICELVSRGRRVGLVAHCLVEFTGVVTNPRIWKQPSSPAQVRAQILAWTAPPKMQVLTEQADFVQEFIDLVESSGVYGGGVHDARIAACCIAHGVRTLWTADRDFGRFPALRTVNPLVT